LTLRAAETVMSPYLSRQRKHVSSLILCLRPPPDHRAIGLGLPQGNIDLSFRKSILHGCLDVRINMKTSQRMATGFSAGQTLPQ